MVYRASFTHKHTLSQRKGNTHTQRGRIETTKCGGHELGTEVIRNSEKEKDSSFRGARPPR